MKPTPALLAKIAQQVKAATAAASAPALPPPPPAPEQPAKPKATRIPAGHTRHPTDPTACLDVNGYVKRRSGTGGHKWVFQVRMVSGRLRYSVEHIVESVLCVSHDQEGMIFISGKWRGPSQYQIVNKPEQQ